MVYFFRVRMGSQTDICKCRRKNTSCSAKCQCFLDRIEAFERYIAPLSNGCKISKIVRAKGPETYFEIV